MAGKSIKALPAIFIFLMMKSIKLVTLLFFILGFISCEKEIEVPIENNVQVTVSTYEYNSQGYPVKKNNMIRYEYR